MTTGIVLPDENLFTSVQKITFSTGAYGFYVETGFGCALVFPNGKTIHGVRFFGEHFNEVYAVEDVAYIGFRDGRIYAVDSEWIELRDVCPEWQTVENLFTLDPDDPVIVTRDEFENAFRAFGKTIFYEPLANYAFFCAPRSLVSF